MGSVDHTKKNPDIQGLSRVAWRLLPLLCIAFVLCILDRINLSFAAARMNLDLGLSAASYGLGAGLFFLGYFFFEIPSNLLLAGLGARRWIARIMVSWGLVSMAMALIIGPASFYTVRLLLGLAEAGFLPGVIYFVNQWFPAPYVRRPLGVLFAFGPLGSAIGAPLSLFLIERLGWRWMFALEALPAIATGIAIFYLLPDRPDDATWLSHEEKQALNAIAPGSRAPAPGHSLVAALFERSSILLALQYFLILTAAYTIQLWLPLIAHEIGFTAGQLTWVVTIPYGLSAAAIGLYGLFASGSAHATAWVVGSMLVTAAGFFIGAATGDLTVALLCFCLVMCGTYLGAAAYWTLPRPLVTGAGAAAAIALSNACGNLGGFIGPLFMGIAREHFGNYQSALAVAGAISVAAAAMTFFSSTVRGPRLSDHDDKQTYPA